MSESLEPVLIHAIAGRSGTTLVMQLLGTSPQIAFDRVYPYETRYLTWLLRWAQMLGLEREPGGFSTFPDIPPGESVGRFPYLGSALWDGDELWPRCFRAAWREFSRVAIARTREEQTEAPIYYAEKTGVWVPERLRQAIPHRLVLLVRDPRDVFLSITAFDQKRGFPGFNRLADDDDRTFARRFIELCRQTMKGIREAEAEPRSILVKYENLAMDLPGEAARISEWLGVSIDAGAVQKQAPELAHHMTSTTAHESVGRWRRELAPELNELFVKELGRELNHFGYPT